MKTWFLKISAWNLVSLFELNKILKSCLDMYNTSQWMFLWWILQFDKTIFQSVNQDWLSFIANIIYSALQQWFENISNIIFLTKIYHCLFHLNLRRNCWSWSARCWTWWYARGWPIWYWRHRYHRGWASWSVWQWWWWSTARFRGGWSAVSRHYVELEKAKIFTKSNFK